MRVMGLVMAAGDLKNEKYIALETYKKDGSAVKTPVWFVLQNDLVHVVTREKTGKVKRLKNNQAVRIATCTIKGNVTGAWYSGTASRLASDKTVHIIKLRDEKYGFMSRIVRLASRGKGEFVAYLIRVKNNADS